MTSKKARSERRWTQKGSIGGAALSWPLESNCGATQGDQGHADRQHLGAQEGAESQQLNLQTNVLGLKRGCGWGRIDRLGTELFSAPVGIVNRQLSKNQQRICGLLLVLPLVLLLVNQSAALRTSALSETHIPLAHRLRSRAAICWSSSRAWFRGAERLATRPALKQAKARQ